MKNIAQFILFLLILFSALSAASQGWVAEIDLDLNHNLYAFEKITNASVTFSGVKVNGSSSTSQIQLIILGEGPIAGDISLAIDGIAWDPYDRQDPESVPLSVLFTGNYASPCETGFFEANGATPDERVYIWITIYPRMQISDFLQTCNELQLKTNTCSPSMLWEVSDGPTSNFKTIPGKITADIIITREELVSLGFSNPYGRKYFRVTGLFNTTSPLQPVDIYYPGPAAAMETTPPKCHNGNDGSVTVNITTNSAEINDFVVTLFETIPQINPISQNFIVDGSQIQFSGLAAGNYMIRVENNTSISIYGGCWMDYTFELIDPDPVSINSHSISDYNGYQLTCYGAEDGRIEVTPSGGTNIYDEFQWTPFVSSTSVAANLVEGDYHLKVKDSNNCWSVSYNYSIRAPERMTLQLQSTGGKNGYDVSCQQHSDGEIMAGVIGGVKPYRFEWSDGRTTSNLVALGVGTYKLVVTDENGCIVDDSISLFAPDPISFEIAETSSITCPGGLTGTLEIQATTNTIGEVSYLWSSGENRAFIQEKPSGTYTATVTDAQGCTGTRLHTLMEPLPYSVSIVPASDFNGSPIRCHGEDNGVLDAILRDDNGITTNADSYTWTKNGSPLASGTELSTVSGLTSGIYAVRVTYRTVCFVEQSFVMSEPEPVSVVILNVSNYNGVPISCYGMNDGSISASASGGTGKIYSYLWRNGEATRDLLNIGAGSYHVTVTDSNGCEGAATKTLEGPPRLKAGITVLSDFTGQPLSCSGAADARLRGTHTGGTAPFTYQWNSGQSIQEIAGLPAGKYILEIKDMNECLDTSEIFVADPRPVSASFQEVSHYNGYNVTCAGENDGSLLAQGSGGTGKYTYQWQESLNTGPLHENLNAGSYTVIVTDENGCRDMTTGLINEPPPLSLGIEDLRNVSCNKGTDGKIKLATSGGAGEFWFSAGDGKWQTQPLLDSLIAGVYEPLVQDANGCIQTVTATLTEPPMMMIDFINIQPSRCGDALGEISTRVTGGTGDYRYLWQDSEDRTIGTTANISGLYPGIYTLFLTDLHSCTVVRSTGISSLDGPKAIIKNILQVTCADSDDGAATAEVLEGHGPFSYEWSDGQKSAQAENLPKGIYLLKISDANDCATVEVVTIPGPLPVEISLVEKVEPDCHNSCNGKLSVTARGGNGDYSFWWQGYKGPAIDHLCAGKYAVTVADRSDCRTTASFELHEPEPLTVKAVARLSPRCPGQCDGQLEINARGGTGQLSYKWDGGLVGPAIKDLCSGSYTTQISDANECIIVATYTLEEPVSTPLELGGPLLLCKGQTHTLDAGPAWKEYTWTGPAGFMSSARYVTLTDAGEYVLEAIDLKGCSVRDTFFLDTSDELLEANFLLAAEAVAGDTVVIIDISWPLPENIYWIFPGAMKRIHDLGDIIHGQFAAPGKFEVTLKATLDECEDQLTKSITIIERDSLKDQAGRVRGESLVNMLTVFPNPNEGVFELVVELPEESPIILTVWSIMTSRKVIQLADAGGKRYQKYMDLRPLSAGSYILRLDYTQGARNIRFIVR